MTRNAVKIDQVSIVRATDFAKGYCDDTIAKAMQVLTDPNKKERISKLECLACWYLMGKIGGAATTEQDCGICGKTQLYGSTCTDVLCRDCAKEKELCRHCGADLHLRPRRKLDDKV